jgi:hypothetical protein
MIHNINIGSVRRNKRFRTITQVLFQGDLNEESNEKEQVYPIPCFGACSSAGNRSQATVTYLAQSGGGTVTGRPCEPFILAPWLHAKDDVTIWGQKALTTDSVLVCANGGFIRFVTSGQEPGMPLPIPAEVEEEATQELHDKITAANSWLDLHSKPTYGEGGRIVNIPADATPKRWAMKEDQAGIPKTLRDQGYVANSGRDGAVLDANGRYWVAVGPNVMNRDHQSNEKITYGEMRYGTELDIKLAGENGKTYYVYATVCDVKAHTWPNGIYQTGRPFPNGEPFASAHVDGSIVEFRGKTDLKNLTDYEIIEIIVYDQDEN